MDYTALQQAWNSPTQPPTGVTGQPLLAGDTTDQKVTKVNGWTVAAPQKAMFAPSDLLNSIVDTDLAALTAMQVSQLTLLLQGSMVDCSKGTTIRSTAMGLFSGKTSTIQKLAALVAPFDNATSTWCEANNYPYLSSTMGNLNTSDAINAGLT